MKVYLLSFLLTLSLLIGQSTIAQSPCQNSCIEQYNYGESLAWQQRNEALINYYWSAMSNIGSMWYSYFSANYSPGIEASMWNGWDVWGTTYYIDSTYWWTLSILQDQLNNCFNYCGE